MKTNFARGTASYRSPEVLENQKYNNRTDIFALGCIIFELITGQKLFSNDWAVHQYTLSGNSIFPSNWPLSEHGSPLYSLGELASELLAVLPTRRPGAVQTIQRLRRIKTHQQFQGPIVDEFVNQKGVDPTSEFAELSIADDAFLIQQDNRTPLEMSPPAPLTVLRGLRMLGSSRSAANSRKLDSSRHHEEHDTIGTYLASAEGTSVGYDYLLSVINT